MISNICKCFVTIDFAARNIKLKGFSFVQTISTITVMTFYLILHSENVKFNEILVDDISPAPPPCQDFTSRYILFVKMMDFMRCFSQDFFFFSKQIIFDLQTDAQLLCALDTIIFSKSFNFRSRNITLMFLGINF